MHFDKILSGDIFLVTDLVFFFIALPTKCCQKPCQFHHVSTKMHFDKILPGDNYVTVLVFVFFCFFARCMVSFFRVKSGLSVYVSDVVKVSKSQKQFLLKLHCPKNERNI